VKKITSATPPTMNAGQRIAEHGRATTSRVDDVQPAMEASGNRRSETGDLRRQAPH
jgi:hypothetical protein